jgi:hypothetical protein
MKTYNEMVEIKAANEERLLDRPGVTGVGIGYKVTDGKRTGEMAIRVYVAEKKPEDEIPKSEVIPKTVKGVKTDVIERKFVLHALRMMVAEMEIQADTTRYEQLMGGMSIGPCRSIWLEPPDVPVAGWYLTTGTLGCIVQDNATNDPMLLSNFHVMCVDDQWHAGDTMSQPSRADGGTCPGDVVAELTRGSLGGELDCAVARHTARDYACEILEIGPVRGTAAAVHGMAVRKRGRTTGLTYGTVTALNVTVLDVDYGDNLGLHTLTNQIEIEVDPAQSARWGDHGDSGSVVVDDQGRVIGLYFAGSEDGVSGVANPIDSVLAGLDISLCVPKGKEILPDKPDKDLKWEVKWEPKEIKEKPEPKEAKDKPEPKEVKAEPKELKEWAKELKDRKPELKEQKGEPKELADTGKDPRKELLEPKGYFEDWPWLPSEPWQPREPGWPGGTGPLAQRSLARYVPQAGGQTRLEFDQYPVQATPNPWLLQNVMFFAKDYQGNPLPGAGIKAWGGFQGLDCGYELEIALPAACQQVEVSLVHFVRAATAEAYRSQGGPMVDSKTMSGPERVAETLVLKAEVIQFVRIRAPQNETLLLKLCMTWSSSPESPGKIEREGEKPTDKIQFSDDKPKPEIKERVDKALKEKESPVEKNWWAELKTRSSEGSG